MPNQYTKRLRQHLSNTFPTYSKHNATYVFSARDVYADMSWSFGSIIWALFGSLQGFIGIYKNCSLIVEPYVSSSGWRIWSRVTANIRFSTPCCIILAAGKVCELKNVKILWTPVVHFLKQAGLSKLGFISWAERLGSFKQFGRLVGSIMPWYPPKIYFMASS